MYLTPADPIDEHKQLYAINLTNSNKSLTYKSQGYENVVMLQGPGIPGYIQAVPREILNNPGVMSLWMLGEIAFSQDPQMMQEAIHPEMLLRQQEKEETQKFLENRQLVTDDVIDADGLTTTQKTIIAETLNKIPE